MQVPAQYGHLRFWRNTAVANLAAGQTATLAPGTGVLGYEWDEDADNGFRPAGPDRHVVDDRRRPGLHRLRQHHASNVVKTHHLTLYRAPSGALVFGAGTVQWAWGLDSVNPPGKPADANMQQATMNLFADMRAQPSTLQPGSSPRPPSTDTDRADLDDHQPDAGHDVADGSSVTITGTATDAGGGVVAGVEVSTDGGTTWHPATGTTNWTYRGSRTGAGDARSIRGARRRQRPTSRARSRAPR